MGSKSRKTITIPKQQIQVDKSSKWKTSPNFLIPKDSKTTQCGQHLPTKLHNVEKKGGAFSGLGTYTAKCDTRKGACQTRLTRPGKKTLDKTHGIRTVKSSRCAPQEQRRFLSVTHRDTGIQLTSKAYQLFCFRNFLVLKILRCPAGTSWLDYLTPIKSRL